MKTADFLIIGGGVIGVNLALATKRRFPKSRILLIEKEAECGLHASGRNSGVLHAGFYYTADSLKARFTREGNRLLTAYCLEKGLRVNRCGKLVVARNEQDWPTMDELLRRGQYNGVDLEEISAEEARRIEPRVKTCGKALWSPTTASVDPREVMHSMVADARNADIEIMVNTPYRGFNKGLIRAGSMDISANYVINAAGLYADKVARDFGFSSEYAMLPFKGLYLYSREAPGSLRTNIYPLPDLANPFLGVHYTLTVDGKNKIGPTAIPAFWREHYEGLQGFNLQELLDITGREALLFLRNDFNFRGLAWQELGKYSRRRMVSLAEELASPARLEDFQQWGKPGIRAQLLHLPTRRLEMDFRYEGDARSFHVLNTVSPGFTCSLSFTTYLVDQMVALMG